MKRLLLHSLVFILGHAPAQSVNEKLELAVRQLESDSQLSHAILGLYVSDGKTGQKVYEHHAQIGLAPASCQKIFTSAAALDLLGPEFRYATELGYDGIIEKNVLKGNLHLLGCGDPTLGSWRWEGTKAEVILQEIMSSLQQAHIHQIDGSLLMDDSKFSLQPIPDGWIWQDIGNYYGAGCWAINWHENQYDMILRPGNRVGEPAEVIGSKPDLTLEAMVNQLTTGEKGSGDNGYIYLAPYSTFGFTQGTIPLGEQNFTISGSMPYPALECGIYLQRELNKQHLKVQKGFRLSTELLSDKKKWPSSQKIILRHLSPSLESINYWFLKKSINLYGEAMIKTMAYIKTGSGSTEKGVELLNEFWKLHGIETSALHILDGSGLSPQNRVTCRALVSALEYASSRPWFSSFYQALPEINGMKMKSGSIGGARSYAGYQYSGDGKQYLFAILINNYDGDSNLLVKKMWRVLDILK